MRSSKKILWFFIFLIGFLIIAIAGFGVVFVIKSYTKPTTITSPKAQTTPIPAPTGFQTYQNKEQKIAVSYPTGMVVKEKSYGMGVSTVEMRTPENKDPNNTADVQLLTVPKAMASAIGQNFDEYYGMDENTSKIINSPMKNNEAEKFTKVKNRSINGMRAVEYSSVPEPNTANQEAEIGVFIETGDELSILATGESHRDELETMISTFTYPISK